MNQTDQQSRVSPLYGGSRIQRLRQLHHVLGVRGAAKYLQARQLKQSRVRVKPRRASEHLWIRPGESDISTLWQVFANREFDLRLAYQPTSILDGGANIGCASIQFCKSYPSAIVVAVEPDAGNFEILELNTAGLPNLHRYQAGIWSSEGHLRCTNPDALGWARQFDVTDHPGADSVPCSSVATLARRVGLSHFDLVKLDIEGAEAELFASQDLGWLERSRVVLIETHGSTGDIVIPALNRFGFRVSVLGEKLLAIRGWDPGGKEVLGTE